MSATLAASLALIAIVTQNQVVLRAAPGETASQQAVLWQGDNLEVRARKQDYLQVWDHRRERGGYVHVSQVRTYTGKPEEAPELMAVSRFLRDTPGAEALGIAVTAAYLKAAPREAIGAEAFDNLGTFAERLANRAAQRAARNEKGIDTTLAAHLEIAASYGVTMHSFEQDGRMQLCYNGEAFRRVMALPAQPEQRARAALALTRHDCVNPALPPSERAGLDQWRLEVLDRVELAKLPENLKNRLHLRKAGILAAQAHASARRADPAQKEAQRAIDELAAINKSELGDEDLPAYSEAAIRVGASRWAADNAPAATRRLAVLTRPGQPGETCVHLVESAESKKPPLVTRCTYGVVWPQSLGVDAQGQLATLAVQPLATWREMWVFRKTDQGWVTTVLPPTTGNTELGYIEFAGWVPGGKQLLAVREARVEGRWRRRFELVRIDTLETERWSDKADALGAFSRWQEPRWKSMTLSLR